MADDLKPKDSSVLVGMGPPLFVKGKAKKCQKQYVSHSKSQFSGNSIYDHFSGATRRHDVFLNL